MSHSLVRVLSILTAAVLGSAVAVADDSKLKVKVGDPFPAFDLPATQADKIKPDAKRLTKDDLAGKIAVIAFYPKALTGG